MSTIESDTHVDATKRELELEDNMESRRRICRCLSRGVAVSLLAAGCASSQAGQRTTADDGLTMTIGSQRTQPGCPVLVRIDVASTAPQIAESELTWRVAHGKRQRSGSVVLPLAGQPTNANERMAEVSFTPPSPGTYRIEARVIYHAGGSSVATLYHDVAHRWPFQSPRPCDYDQAVPHEASGEARPR